MGAAIGAGLGLLFGAATGYERQRMQQKHQADQAFLDLATKNPAMFASDPKLLAEVKKRASPEFADLLQGMGKQAQAFQGQIQGAVGGGAPAGQTAPSPSTQMVAGPGVPAPTGAQDPMAAHIAELQQRATNLERVLTSPAAMMEQNKPAVEAARKHLEFIQKEVERLSTEQFQHGEHEETRAFQQQQHEETRAMQEQFHAESAGLRAESIANARQAHADAEAARQQIQQEKTEEGRRKQFDTGLSTYTKAVAAFTDPAKPKVYATEADANAVANFHNKGVESFRKRSSKLLDTSDTDWDSLQLKVEPVPGTVYGVKGYRLVPISGGEGAAAAEEKAAGVEDPTEAAIRKKHGL